MSISSSPVADTSSLEKDGDLKLDPSIAVESSDNNDIHDTSGGSGGFTPALARKLDLHILTPMFFLNFLSLMGRTNIGAALIQKLPADLKMNAMKIFAATAMPLIMLIAFEIPSNLLMKWLDKRWGFPYMRYLSAITVGLGIITLGQAFDQNYGALIATRFLVGIFDAGLMPGSVFLLSLYYPSEYLQWRLSILMASNVASNIVSNILAYGIANIHNTNGWHGWRWIFLVEGLLTFAVGTLCLVFSAISRPEKAKDSFLSVAERDSIASAVESRKSQIGTAAEWRIFLSNPLNYSWAALYVFTTTTLYSAAIFAPSFVQAFHPTWTTPEIQGQVVPVFVVAGAVTLMSGAAADRLNHRLGFALLGYVITIVGYALLREPHKMSPGVLQFGLYLVSMGTYISLTMIWALTCLNSATPFQKALGTAFVIGIGNVGGFVSAWIFRSSEAPYYINGMTTGLIITAVAAGLVLVTWGYMVWSNGQRPADRDEGKESLKTGAVPRWRL